MPRKLAIGTPGIRRFRNGRGFTYKDPKGRVLRGKARDRVERLAIQPAWRKVWISRDPHGHIQATGVDDAGRKQYLYHPEWRAGQDLEKYDRLVELARALPGLRHDVAADLARDGFPRERVVAAVVRALELSFGRVGSERYAKKNGSFGLASLPCRHAEIVGGAVVFRFPTKGGQQQELEMRDADLVRLVGALRKERGDRLFRYRDEAGRWRPVRARDVNEYVKTSIGDRFSVKDLRTWGASVLFATLLSEAGPAASKKERREVVRETVKEVAERLGNTPAVCRRSYIHHAIAAAYLEGSFARRIRSKPSVQGLWPEEERALAVLEGGG